MTTFLPQFCGRRHQSSSSALKKALKTLADLEGKDLATEAQEAGAEILGASSLKAALDLDWDDFSWSSF